MIGRTSSRRATPHVPQAPVPFAVPLLPGHLPCGSLTTAFASTAPTVCTPLAFGAKGDGVTRDTAAIQHAIDSFSSSHVIIDHVYADVGDDDIAIKSGMPGSPGPDAPSRDITITNCTFMHGHGLSVGSEIAGGAQHIHANHVTFDGLRNDGINNLDSSVLKNIALGDKAHFQLRFETFNSFNHPIFGPPNVTPTSSAFGITTKQANTSRQIQIGGRITF